MKLSALGAVLVAGSFALTGCTINVNSGDADNGMNHGMMNNDDSNTAMTENELMFAQMMIPHHQQAIDMSDLAPARSSNKDVLGLAEQIKAAQAPEIAQMKTWLTDAGLDPNATHDMGMGGMLSDDELAALAGAKGTTFDRLYLTGMIGHHRGAIQMAQMILGSDNDEAKALGEAIVKTQQNEIIYMQGLLEKLG